MAEWEQHFDKLQHGLIFDENNPNLINISISQNCNKKLIQNDAGSSQDKSYNKYKKHSLDECFKIMIKRLRAIPKHAINDIGGKKRWTPNPKMRIFFTRHLIQKHKTKTIAKTCVYAAKNIFGIWMKKTSLIMDHGKNVTIAKNIMNYV